MTAVGVGSVGAATLATFVALFQYLGQPEKVLVETYFTWIHAGEHLGRRLAPARPAVGGDARLRHLRRLPDPRLLGRLHARRDRPRLRALLRLPEPVHVRDAGAGARRQPAGAVRRLGGRRALLLPADRLLLREGLVRRRPARRRSSSTGSATSASCSRSSPPSPAFGTARVHRRCSPTAAADPEHFAGAATVIGLLPVRRRDRQVGADPALRLAARRHGRPDPGVGPDPRRHHGHRRRVHGGPLQRALPAEPHRHAGGGAWSAA